MRLVRSYLRYALLLIALPVLAQSNAGELRLKVTDPDGLAIKASVLSQRTIYHSDGTG
jgi:hypothetical protein